MSNNIKMHIQDLALAVETLAKEKGFTSIEPSPQIISVNANDTGVSAIDFVLRKENNFAGRATVLVTNRNIETQTVEQLSEIEFKS